MSGIHVLIDYGRFAVDGSTDIDDILAGVHWSIRKTCSKLGPLSFFQRIFVRISTQVLNILINGSRCFPLWCLIFSVFADSLGSTSPRFYFPRKPHLTVANLGGDDGYAELGTRFKAADIKLLVWWLAKETQDYADKNPDAPFP